MEDDAGDVLGLLRAPGGVQVLAAVERAVDAVADRDAVARVPLARAHPDDVRIGLVDGDGADRGDRLVVEDRRPGEAAVDRLPDAAGGAAGVQDVGIGLDDVDRRHAAAHGGGADRARLEAGEQIRIEAGGGGEAGGHGQQEEREDEAVPGLVHSDSIAQPLRGVNYNPLRQMAPESVPGGSPMPFRFRWLVSLAFAFLLSAPLLSQPPQASPDAKAGEDKAKDKDKDKDKEKKPLEDKLSRTQHTLTLDGQKIAYTATAGTLLLSDEDGTAKASIFYVAYIRDGVKDPATRPVTFSFNGGPGAASLWVHMGAFGPKRVERDDEGFGLPPPGRLVDNDQSILDLTDLVFIDPVSTGYSRPAPGQDPKQFHGVKRGHRVGGRVHPPLGHPQRALGLAQVHRRRELRHHPRRRPRLPSRGAATAWSSTASSSSPPSSTGRTRTSTPATTCRASSTCPPTPPTAWYHKKLPPELSGDLSETLARSRPSPSTTTRRP